MSRIKLNIFAFGDFESLKAAGSPRHEEGRGKRLQLEVWKRAWQSDRLHALFLTDSCSSGLRGFPEQSVLILREP